MSATRGWRGWSRRAGAALVLAALACGAPDADAPDRTSAEVTRLLYRENLLADPEVNQRMNHVVLAISRDGAAADSVLPEFHRWLAAWARAHPERVGKARLQAGVQRAGWRARSLE